jgi:hypothetical protein
MATNSDTTDNVITVHVTCGGLKKLVTSKKSMIEAEIRKMLVADHDIISVQYFDKNWDDWVDISFEDITSNMKLQILQQLDFVVPVQDISADLSLSGSFVNAVNTSGADLAADQASSASFVANTSVEDDNRSIMSTSTVDYCIRTQTATFEG